MKRFKVGDSVWAMRADRPEERTVFGVLECSNINGNATILFYQLTDGRSHNIRAYGELPGNRYDARNVHATKKELLDSFL